MKNPTATAEYFLREMHRDGLPANEHTVALLLKLFSRNCFFSNGTGEVGYALQQAQSFLKSCTRDGYIGHKAVPVSERAMVEIVKANCLAKQGDLIMESFKDMEATYGLKPTAAMYEPVLFNYACMHGKLSAADEIYMQMIGDGLLPTSEIMDVMVRGRLFHEEEGFRDALDWLQETYTSYGTKPSVATLILLIDASLERGDVPEARRVVAVIEQIFTEAERRNAVYVPRIYAFASSIKAEMKQQARKAAEDQQARLEEAQDAAVAADEAAAAAAAAQAVHTAEGSGGGHELNAAVDDGADYDLDAHHALSKLDHREPDVLLEDTTIDARASSGVGSVLGKEDSVKWRVRVASTVKEDFPAWLEGRRFVPSVTMFPLLSHLLKKGTPIAGEQLTG